MAESTARTAMMVGLGMRRATIAATLVLTLACASSSSHERFEQDYALRWQVNVTAHLEEVKSCERVASFEIASLPCANLLHNVYMAGTECARFWTVDHGGDTLLVKGRASGVEYEKAIAGDVYVCHGPLLPPEALEAVK